MIDLTIRVEDAREADLIKTGLAHPIIRAMVKVAATLATLPDDASRERAVRAACILMDQKYPGDRK